MYLRYFVIKSPWKRAGSCIWTNLNPVCSRVFYTKFAWNWPSCSWRRWFFYLILWIYFAWKRAGPSFEKNWIPFNLRCFVPSLVEIDSVLFWRRGFFFNFVNVFLQFHDNLTLEKGGPFIWRKLNPVYRNVLCAKFGWNWLSCSGEEDFFLISSMYFHNFVIISP